MTRQPTVDPAPEGDLPPGAEAPQTGERLAPDRHAGAPTRLHRLGRFMGWPLACYVASRIVMFLGVLWVRYLEPTLTVQLVFRQWDGFWYHRIVTRGYPTDLTPLDHPSQFIDGAVVRLNPLPFFPGYPMVARGFNAVVPIGPLATLVLVSLVFGLAATVCFFHLTRQTLGAEVAERATLLFVFFPGAWVLGFPYSEAMMLTFAMLCFLALGRERWGWAGAAAAVATFTRANAIFLLPACAWVAFVAIRRNRDWKALWAPVLAPMGMLAYFTYLKIHTGNFFMWHEAETKAWGERFDFGRTTFDLVVDFVQHPLTDDRAALVTASVVLTLVGIVALFLVRIPWSMRIFALGVAVLPILSHVLVARPRWVFAAFPLIMALGALIPKRYLAVVVPVSAAMMAMVVVYYGYFSSGPVGFIPP